LLDIVAGDVGLITELGAETDPARTAALSFSISGEALRRGFDGEPMTVGRPATSIDSVDEECELVPNPNPPERRLPCFFDKLPSLWKVEEVDAANPPLDVRGEGRGRSWLTSFHPSPSHPVLPLVRGPGNAETGRGFRGLLGVASVLSVSVSESLPFLGIGNKVECGNGKAVKEVEYGRGGVPPSPGIKPVAGWYGDLGDGEGKWKPLEKDRPGGGKIGGEWSEVERALEWSLFVLRG